MGALNYKTRRNRRHRLAAELACTWTPRRLFTFGSSVGWAHWYDSPSDYPGGSHPYLYQDSAGTTPATAVGQSVGLILDRAYGGMRGPELSTYSAGFSSTSGITVASATVALNGSALEVTSTGAAGNNYAVVPVASGMTIGRTYEVVVRAKRGAQGVQQGLAVFSFATITARAVSAGASYVSYSWRVVTTATSGTMRCYAADAAGAIGDSLLIESISVREIPGTHRIQATSASRPLLMARVNQLLNTEFAGAVAGSPGTAPTSWGLTVATGTTATPGSGVLTLSATTGNRQFIAPSSGIVLGANASWVFRFEVTAVSGPSAEAIAALTVTAGAATVSSAITVADGVGVKTITAVAGAAGATVFPRLGVGVAGGATGDTSVSFRRPDFRTADDAAKNIPSYQRVGATAADHDTAGFPHAAYPDGTDDFDTTSTGGGGTSGFFFCGVLTVSGGAGTARTIWSDTGTNTGYRVRINASNKLELAAGNGSAYTTVQSNETITAPGTYLLSAWDDGGVLAVQVGNAAAATTTRPTVSAGTTAITSYRDNGAATSYFNGRDYGSVYRQTYPGETAHNRLKVWQARRAGINV